MSLILPQFGIFAQGTHAHYFLEFDLVGPDAEESLRAFGRLRAPEVSSGGVNIVIAFGRRAWQLLAPAHAPAGLADFETIDGAGGRRAPGTQHDAWLWISGSEPDVVWDRASAATRTVARVARLAAEQPGFTYRNGRDITGFVDGTANPATRLAGDVALVPGGEPGEGGSHVLAMRWVHDLAAFESLPVGDQERVFGRTKQDSVELGQHAKPPTAHIARVEVESGGMEEQIFRRSVPYGTVREHGLYFVAFSADRARYDHMLARMFGIAGDGLHDRLTDFSKPVSGAYYFAPSLNVINELIGEQGD